MTTECPDSMCWSGQPFTSVTSFTPSINFDSDKKFPEIIMQVASLACMQHGWLLVANVVRECTH